MYLYLLPGSVGEPKWQTQQASPLSSGKDLVWTAALWLKEERRLLETTYRNCGLLRRCLLRGDGVSLKSWLEKGHGDRSYVITIQQVAAFLVGGCSQQAEQLKEKLHVCICSGVRKRHERVRLKGRFDNCHRG